MPTESHRPVGFRAVTPYLIVPDADRVLRFLAEAFGARERSRTARPDGTVAHAELWIGDAVVELAEARDEWPAAPAALHLYVEDADATYRRALDAGAESLYEPMDQPYGDRDSGVRDPGGTQWFIATRRASPADENTAEPDRGAQR